jgi:hypothetical protein
MYKMRNKIARLFFLTFMAMIGTLLSVSEMLIMVWLYWEGEYAGFVLFAIDSILSYMLGIWLWYEVMVEYDEQF